MCVNLTTEHCLYVLKDHQLQNFIELLKTIQMPEKLFQAKALNETDRYATVLQIWCLLNEEELYLVINPSKIMPYSIDHYILNLLRKNDRIQKYISHHEMTQEQKYILSFYLANATLQWGDLITLEHEKGIALVEENAARDYFLAATHHNLNTPEQTEFYMFQK